jgi:hypothetical protein
MCGRKITKRRHQGWGWVLAKMTSRILTERQIKELYTKVRGCRT